MIGLPDKAVLTQCSTGEEIEAAFVRLTRPTVAAEIDAVWWPELNRRVGRRQQKEDDEHWQWSAIADRYAVRGGWCVGLETGDRRIQGAMAYTVTTGKEGGGSLVHIGRIATAPWNRAWLFQQPEYRGTGTKLLLYAVAHSYLLGLDGVTALDAISTDRTLRFYGVRGFVMAGRKEDGTISMALSADNAKDWLIREGLIK